jgi:hypothetical protein
MTNELGRELTSAEMIALATGQTTIMDILHGVALELDEARRQEVAVVMPSGVVLTLGDIEDEVRATRVNARRSWPLADRNPLILGVNASSNMFA